MAKHRELAQIVYATTAGKLSSSRIWKTVVVAGAMLGAPLTAAAKDPPPAQSAQAPVKEKQQAPVAGKAAPLPAPPPAVDDKAAAAAAAKELVKSIEEELKAHDIRVKEQAAADKKARADLQARLKQAKADAKKADAEAKAEERAKNPPRPRVQDRGPVGRGFILS